MTPAVLRGRLLDPSAAPPTGERFETLLTHGNLVVEQILSAHDPDTSEQVQTHDEWVVVLAGDAILDVAGERLDLAAGDWVFLPSGTAHRVLRTAPGTSWLAVHLRGP